MRRPLLAAWMLVAAADGQVREAHATAGGAPIIDAQSLRAAAMPDCAPWDGHAIRLTIDLSMRERLDVSLWGASLERMTGGPATIVIDGIVSASGTGRATVCPSTGGTAANPCRQVTGRVELDASGTREGAPLRGRAVIREAKGAERTFPFSVRITTPPGREVICG